MDSLTRMCFVHMHRDTTCCYRVAAIPVLFIRWRHHLRPALSVSFVKRGSSEALAAYRGERTLQSLVVSDSQSLLGLDAIMAIVDNDKKTMEQYQPEQTTNKTHTRTGTQQTTDQRQHHGMGAVQVFALRVLYQCTPVLCS
eukprot:6030409-Amphidinium_carterae.1